MGGTGKTPLTREVVAIITEELALDTVVLSRGYGSENREWHLLVSRRGEILSSAQFAGDEALLLAHWLDKSSVVVGKRRAISGKWAVEALGVSAVVLDDGFQYWRLERDLDIVTVSALTGFGNGLLFPRGPLREGLFGLQRAGVVVITQAAAVAPKVLKALKTEIRRWSPSALVLQGELCAQAPRLVDASRSDAERPFPDSDAQRLADAARPVLDGRRVLALCGLGTPASFRSTLEGLGAEISDLLEFEDHHRYTVQELDAVVEQAERAGVEAIVMTEKDEVNLPEHWKYRGSIDLICVPVRFVFGAGDRRELVEFLQQVHPRRGEAQ